MKTSKRTMYHSFSITACAGAVLLMTSAALAQNLFVSDSNGNIYEITPGGAQSTFASGLSYPYGIAFNSAGDLFVGDSADNAGETGNITEITPNGTASVFASGLDPHGVAFNTAGDLFEEDYNTGNLYEYTPKGVQSTFATGLSFPLSMAFNSSGYLFVGEGYGSGNGYIEEITPTGTQSTFASGLNFPNALAFNNAGDLFEADVGSGTVFEFSPTGGRSTFASISGANALAFNSAGDLFVASSSGLITEVAPNGTQTSFASVSGIPTAIEFQPVPEPSVFGLAGAGAVAWIAFAYSRKGRMRRV